MDYTGRIKYVRRLEDVLLIYPLAIGIYVGAHNARHGRWQAGTALERSGWRQSAFVARQHLGIREINPRIPTPVVRVHRDIKIAAILPDPSNWRVFDRRWFKLAVCIDDPDMPAALCY